MFGKLFLLIVVALAVAVTIPKTRAMLLQEAKPLVDRVKEKIVPGRLDSMVKELMAEVNRGEPLPTEGKAWDQWLHYAYTGDAVDPWGHLYYLDVDRMGFTVGSMGPDGMKGDSDDITARHQNERDR